MATEDFREFIATMQRQDHEQRADNESLEEEPVPERSLLRTMDAAVKREAILNTNDMMIPNLDWLIALESASNTETLKDVLMGCFTILKENAIAARPLPPASNRGASFEPEPLEMQPRPQATPRHRPSPITNNPPDLPATPNRGQASMLELMSPGAPRSGSYAAHSARRDNRDNIIDLEQLSASPSRVQSNTGANVQTRAQARNPVAEQFHAAGQVTPSTPPATRAATSNKRSGGTQEGARKRANR